MTRSPEIASEKHGDAGRCVRRATSPLPSGRLFTDARVGSPTGDGQAVRSLGPSLASGHVTVWAKRRQEPRGPKASMHAAMNVPGKATRHSVGAISPDFPASSGDARVSHGRDVVAVIAFRTSEGWERVSMASPAWSGT